MVQTYDKFLSYVVERRLQDAYDMRPIVNGSEISKALKVKSGPWMSKALEMMIDWQLLHPEITEKGKALQELCNRRTELGLGPEN